MLRRFQIGPFLITGYSRFIILAPTFIIKTILGCWELDVGSLGPTMILISVDYGL